MLFTMNLVDNMGCRRGLGGRGEGGNIGIFYDFRNSYRCIVILKNWAREYVGDPPSARNVLGSNNNELEWDYKLKFIENKKSTCNFFGHGKCQKNIFLTCNRNESFNGRYLSSFQTINEPFMVSNLRIKFF